MSVMIKHIDVDVATGAVVWENSPTTEESRTVYRILLPMKLWDAVPVYEELMRMPRIDRSTYARLYGAEVVDPTR